VPSLSSTDPLIIAHRGSSADAPENSLAAFQLAWDQGADGIEGDFRLTADGQIVCIHDEDTARTTGAALIVERSTAAELQSLDAGKWKGDAWRGERIPLLAEVLRIVPQGKRAFLELKSGVEIVGPLADELSRFESARDRIDLMSFDAEVVRLCRERLSDIRCLWLTDFKLVGSAWRPTAEEIIAMIELSRADGIGVENRPNVVNEGFVTRLRDCGIRDIHVWTVNYSSEIASYGRLGVTSLITNHPALLRRHLGHE
jgi:glycerophosphoryl diester phosphodiesterase